MGLNKDAYLGINTAMFQDIYGVPRRNSRIVSRYSKVGLVIQFSSNAFVELVCVNLDFRIYKAQKIFQIRLEEIDFTHY